MRILINALSCAGQFLTTQQLQAALARLTDCFDLIRHPLDSGNARLVYDYRIESRGVIQGCDSLKECLARVEDRDLRAKWYHYTRNRAEDSFGNTIEVSLVAAEDVVQGEIDDEILSVDFVIGFGGKPVLDAGRVQVKQSSGLDSAVREFRNIACSVTFWACFPKYEPNPKHRADRYVRDGGEVVAPMGLTDEEAQACLFCSVVYEGHRFGIARSKHYRFMEHLNGVFHGYQVQSREVPEAVVQLLSRPGRDPLA